MICIYPAHSIIGPIVGKDGAINSPHAIRRTEAIYQKCA